MGFWGSAQVAYRITKHGVGTMGQGPIVCWKVRLWQWCSRPAQRSADTQGEATRAGVF